MTRGKLVVDMAVYHGVKDIHLSEAWNPFCLEPQWRAPRDSDPGNLSDVEVRDLLDQFPVLTEEDILGLMSCYCDWNTCTCQCVYRNTRGKVFQLAKEMADARTKTVSPNNKSVTSDTSTNTGGETSEDSTASSEMKHHAFAKFLQ